MELYQLRAFTTVGKLGSVTRAAEVLSIKQPAATAQLRSLEESLGVALFERVGGKLSMTRAGEALLPRAELILRLAAELRGTALRMQGELDGSLQFGAPSEAQGILRLGSLANEVRKTLPMVELSFAVHPIAMLLDRVKAGEMAAAYYVGTTPPRGVSWTFCRQIDYVAAIPPALAEGMEKDNWHALAAQPWIDCGLDSIQHRMLREAFERHGLRANVTFQLSDSLHLVDLIREGSACGLLRRDVAEEGAAKGQWTLWECADVHANLYLMTSTERSNDPLLVALMSILQSIWSGDNHQEQTP